MWCHNCFYDEHLFTMHYSQYADEQMRFSNSKTQKKNNICSATLYLNEYQCLKANTNNSMIIILNIFCFDLSKIKIQKTKMNTVCVCRRVHKTTSTNSTYSHISRRLKDFLLDYFTLTFLPLLHNSKSKQNLFLSSSSLRMWETERERERNGAVAISFVVKRKKWRNKATAISTMWQ